MEENEKSLTEECKDYCTNEHETGGNEDVNGDGGDGQPEKVDEATVTRGEMEPIIQMQPVSSYDPE